MNKLLFLILFLLSPFAYSQELQTVYYTGLDSYYYSTLDLACESAVPVWNSSNADLNRYMEYTHTDSQYCRGIKYFLSSGTVQDENAVITTWNSQPYDPGVHTDVITPEPDLSDYDSDCEAIKPDFISLEDGLAPVGESFSWTYDGCEFTTSSLWIQEPSGSWSSTVISAIALEVEPSASEPVVVGEGGENTSANYIPTSDPSLDCPWSYVSYDGQDYCYVGDDAPVGDSYADGSTRVDHWDGSYTVTDAQGNSQTYRPDGTPDGTASLAPGGGPAGDSMGCPAWICSDKGIGDDGSDGDGPSLPTEALDFSEGQSWSSGLGSTASCPVPQTVPISFAGFSHDIEFSYQGFCDFASFIRALVLAAAYMSAAFLVYRGVTS